MSNQLSLFGNDGVYEVTATGLRVRRDSTPDEWKQLGEGLKKLDDAKQWAIGDWLVDGKRHYGDGLYQKAAELLGMTEGTLRQYKSLADVIQLSIRIDNLTHAHHQVAQGIKHLVTVDGQLAYGDADYDKIAEFLADAEKNGWTVAELRGRVKAYQEQQRERIRLANEPDKYSLIYADPPWPYERDNHSEDPQHKTLEDHYPTMGIDDLKRLPVGMMAAENCMLFMWATSCKLVEACLPVMESWGFQYKAQMIWNKQAHNVGYYVSVQHEILLIGVKGRMMKPTRLAPSVYAEPRTEHSVKPQYFRDLLVELYPNVTKRAELFARTADPNWETPIGNEVTGVNA